MDPHHSPKAHPLRVPNIHSFVSFLLSSRQQLAQLYPQSAPCRSSMFSVFGVALFCYLVKLSCTSVLCTCPSSRSAGFIWSSKSNKTLKNLPLVCTDSIYHLVWRGTRCCYSWPPMLCTHACLLTQSDSDKLLACTRLAHYSEFRLLELQVE